MPSPKPGARKEETRERILQAAARAIRKHGYEGVGVADVMKDAGLTHGGFYAHFASRDELLAAAVEKAGAESSETLSRVVARARPGEELMTLVDWYLDDRHHDSYLEGLGCAIAAAGTEIPRQHEDVRRAAGRRIKDFVGVIERQLPDWGRPAAHEKALFIAATLVGALTLARGAADPQLSRSIRKSAREAIRAALAN